MRIEKKPCRAHAKRGEKFQCINCGGRNGKIGWENKQDSER